MPDRCTFRSRSSLSRRKRPHNRRSCSSPSSSSTQTVPHAFGADPGHVHFPFSQLSAALQATLQLPQLSTSVVVSTQTLPHMVGVAAGHAHVPLTQVAVLPHSVPHAPQLFESVSKEVQIPAQALGWAGSAQPHTPPAHVWPVGQTTPQLPQFVESFWMSTHELPQAVRLEVSHWHAPAVQRWLPPQTTPHVPQLFGSSTATETPLHVWQASMMPSQSLSTPSTQPCGSGSGRHAQTGWERSSGCTQAQFEAAGQS